MLTEYNQVMKSGAQLLECSPIDAEDVVGPVIVARSQEQPADRKSGA
jgi:hypothetical protein